MNIGDIGPQYLLSLNAQPMKWHVALGELCDNSFDAGASRVEIGFGPKNALCVEDDGNGCANIERMLTLGDHFRQSTTSLGRWGVGLKETACWLWGELVISTVHRGELSRASVDWGRLAKQRDWNVPDPVVTRAEGDARGTTLLFRNITKGFPKYEYIQEELSYYFAPALWSGRQIALKFPRRRSQVCAGWTLPDLEDIVQDRFDVNGKGVRLHAGVVTLGAMNERQGFSICHGHRIILNTALGSKGNSVSRVCGTVELDHAWTLSKNKTEVVDADERGLEDAIYERCKHIFAKSAAQAQLLRNSELETRISESLRNILAQRRKAKRKPRQNNSGTVESKKSSRRHRRASRCQPGDTFMEECDIGSIRMEWQARKDGQLGQVDLPGNVIYLNEEHERLAYHRDAENTEALVDNCMALLAFAAVDSEQKERLPFARDYEGFVDAYSNVLRAQQQTESPQHVEAKQ